VPYLRGVCDPGDYNNANPARTWKVQLSSDSVTSQLRPYTGDIGTVNGFSDFKRGISGRVLQVKVVGASGAKTVSGSTLKGALGFMDDRVWINNDKNVVGTIRAKYDTVSCAPGLPKSPELQIPGGSLQRFQDGTIYRNTKANRTVWLNGDVYAKYVQLKEQRSALGLPTTRIATLTAPAGCDHQTCQRAQFDNGFIYFKADVAAHELHGAVLDYFMTQGGLTGHLGFPSSDVTTAKDGTAMATFQHPSGSAVTVSCPPSGTCTESAGSR
jgi:uncharacterized protein with LGFP repeats